MIAFPPCYALRRFFLRRWGLLPGNAAGGGMWKHLDDRQQETGSLPSEHPRQLASFHGHMFML